MSQNNASDEIKMRIISILKTFVRQINVIVKEFSVLSCIKCHLNYQNAQIREAFEFFNEALALFYDDVTKSI